MAPAHTVATHEGGVDDERQDYSTDLRYYDPSRNKPGHAMGIPHRIPVEAGTRMKKRPKVGDRVEFKYRGEHTGKVHAVAETGVHFIIEMPEGYMKKYRRISLHNIKRIL